MVSERMKGLGTARSVIRELFEYGKIRAAEISAENVFDFSIGNPSIPSPKEVQEAIADILSSHDPILVSRHSSSPAALV